MTMTMANRAATKLSSGRRIHPRQRQPSSLRLLPLLACLACIAALTEGQNPSPSGATTTTTTTDAKSNPSNSNIDNENNKSRRRGPAPVYHPQQTNNVDDGATSEEKKEEETAMEVRTKLNRGRHDQMEAAQKQRQSEQPAENESREGNRETIDTSQYAREETLRKQAAVLEETLHTEMKIDPKTMENIFKAEFDAVVDAHGRHLSPEVKQEMHHFLENSLARIESLNDDGGGSGGGIDDDVTEREFTSNYRGLRDLVQNKMGEEMIRGFMATKMRTYQQRLREGKRFKRAEDMRAEDIAGLMPLRVHDVPQLLARYPHIFEADELPYVEQMGGENDRWFDIVNERVMQWYKATKNEEMMLLHGGVEEKKEYFRNKGTKERMERYERRNARNAARKEEQESKKGRGESVSDASPSQQHSPTSRPFVDDYDDDESNNSYHYHYEQVYDSLFQPSMEEYDLLNWDPYSLSGAPLGGWGRATRSRLASLPIRLVSDFGGGMDLWYASGEENEGDDESSEDKADAAAGHVQDGDDRAASSSEGSAGGSSPPSTTAKVSSGNVSKDVRRSTGPHFSVHDAAGQRYICRVYAEDELVVMSRLDSVFHPATTVWDVEHGSNENAGNSAKLESINDNAKEKEGKGGDDDKLKNFKFSFHSKTGAGMNGKDLPEGLRGSVAKILDKMGMADAAAALARQNNGEPQENIEVEVDMVVGVDMEDDPVLGDGGDGVDAGYADIIRAAAVGAGLNRDNLDGDMPKPSANDNNNEDSKTTITKHNSFPPQFTLDEIHDILFTKLNGLCSQLHLGGWWSYEWCHHEQVRQFHVDISKDPDASGSRPKYVIQDVTLIGKWYHQVEIIYPKGNYNGVYMSGTTKTISYDEQGLETGTTIRSHTTEEDKKYAVDKKNSKQPLGHGGPILRQRFQGGDHCPEVNHRRHMSVELRCCTEDEIDNWIESKKGRSGMDTTTPSAVLVSVQEDEVCSYRSRVCTPLLCPKWEDGSAQATTQSPTTTTNKAPKDSSKNDPIAALLNAVFGDDFGEQYGQVQVFFPDDVVGQEFDELLRLAENGADFENHASFKMVKDALMKLRQVTDTKDLLRGGNAGGASGGVGPSSSGGLIEVMEGMSIRDILDKTLGRRACLLKNLGWWTYEFCHGKIIRQYHANNLIDANTGFSKQKIETEHLLGEWRNSGNSVEDYPHEDEHLHVVNATSGSNSAADLGIGRRKGNSGGGGPKNEKQPGGNGAVYIQEYSHGDVCDHEDVAESVIKGGNVVHGSVQRSSTVRFSCGKRWELIDIKEDSTCHYILDVTVPELCQHVLFKAPVTKTQVVKCLPL